MVLRGRANDDHKKEDVEDTQRQNRAISQAESRRVDLKGKIPNKAKSCKLIFKVVGMRGRGGVSVGMQTELDLSFPRPSSPVTSNAQEHCKEQTES